MTIQNDSELERHIDLQHRAAGFVDALTPAMLPVGGLHLQEIIELMRPYRPDDPIKPYPGPHIPLKNLHFYYLDVDSTGVISCKELYHQSSNHLTDNDVLREINNWIQNTSATAAIMDIENLEWSGPCVIAFAMKPGSWTFFKNANRSAIQFPDGRAISGSGTSTTYHPNKTFYGSRVLSLADGKEVLLVNNYHLLPSGAGPRRPGNPPPQPPEDHYKFDLYFRVTVRKPTGNETLTVIVDPGGKNLGP